MCTCDTPSKRQRAQEALGMTDELFERAVPVFFVAEGALFAKHRGVGHYEFGPFRDLKQLIQLVEREGLEPSTPAL